jgi:hypothetical protein
VFAWVMWVKLPVARKSHQLNILQIYGSLFSLNLEIVKMIRLIRQNKSHSGKNQSQNSKANSTSKTTA